MIQHVSSLCDDSKVRILAGGTRQASVEMAGEEGWMMILGESSDLFQWLDCRLVVFFMLVG